MEEKTIVVGKPSRAARLRLLLIAVGLLLICVLAYVMNLGQCRYGIAYYSGEHYGHNSIFELMFWFGRVEDFGCAIAALMDIGLLLLIPGIITAMAFSTVSITVTDKRVMGISSFGHKVDLPVDEISAVGTSSFKGVSVATSSGRIKFQGIENQNEVHQAITELLMKRQSKPAPAPAQEAAPAPARTAAQELKEYKELLDSGVITQEEFDAKKKQLLGL